MMRFIVDCLRTPRARAPGDEGDTGVVETDERVLAKTTEIRELENAVAVENLELQEQQSDRKELEETLAKLETHKEELVQQLKMTRQLCCEESQQILSLQAEEVQKESQVEEYERELARARWRLRKLRDEVKQAKRRVEEAGERNTPLQDSIRQSYEEILQEQQTLCSLSGGAVTPESQLEESTSPADTIEEETLPMRPWGRSQSLPAYADLIMRTSGSSFCNNLTETREEEDSSPGTPKIDRSEEEEEDDDEEDEGKKENEGENVKREKEELTSNPNPMSQLDFYQADPFVHCQTEHDLFNEDLFPKTDSSDVFAADPFKGTDPFAADVLFPEAGVGAEAGATNADDEAGTSLSCAENKASTGTQCFESEFPDEDSDIEISYSQEDLDAIAMDAIVTDAIATDVTASDEAQGFKPIQSSEEELRLEPARVWRSQGQYSVESDPNGYELDLGAISPPSDVEELSMGSLPGEGATEAAAGPDQDLGSGLPDTFSELQNHPTDLGSGLPDTFSELQTHPTGIGSEPVLSEPDWTDLGATEHPLPREVSFQGEEWDSTIEGEPQNPVTPQNSLDSQNSLVRTNSEQNRQLSFELSYEPASQSSFDPYGFKLSPEHSSHSLLDPDESELSPESNYPDLTFDPDPSFDPYGFDLTSSQMVSQDVFDPYGFKLSPEEENQEVLDICDQDNQEVMELCSYDNQEQVQPSNYSNQEVLEPFTHDNQEMREPCSHNNQELMDFFCHKKQDVMDLGSHNNQELLDFYSNGNQEVLEPSGHGKKEVLDLFSNENQEVVELCSHNNQEALEPCCYCKQELLESHKHNNQQLLEPCNYDNQEVLEPCGHQEVLDLSCHINQEVLDLGIDDNQELLDFCSNENQEVLDLVNHDNQEVLDFLSKDVISEANNNNHCVLEPELSVNPTNNTSNSSASDLASEVCPATMDLLGLELSNTSICTSNTTNKTNTNTADLLNMAANQDLATFSVPTSHNLLEGDLGSVFGAGGYVGCPDVADDLEPLGRRQDNPVAEPVRPVRPVRPPRPSLRAKEKAQSQTQGIDLK